MVGMVGRAGRVSVALRTVKRRAAIGTQTAWAVVLPTAMEVADRDMAVEEMATGVAEAAVAEAANAEPRGHQAILTVH